MIKQSSLLIVANQSLLGDILENLLMSENNHSVRRAAPWEYKNLLYDMSQHGSVVLVAKEEAFGDKLHELRNLTQEYGRLRIITVSSESDKVQIFTSERATMTAAGDLVALVNTFIHPAEALSGNMLGA